MLNRSYRLMLSSATFLAGAMIGMALMRGPAPAHAGGEGHAPAPAGIKAPLAEVIHCPLAFAGVHLQKDRPANAQVAYHYCKPLNDRVSQCILYDGTGPDARLIGIEYLVTDDVYRSMPEEERGYWHDHQYEVDSHLIRSLTQSGDDEKKTLAQVRTLWGKVYHTWAAGAEYPQGPAKLFWSVTGEKPLVLPADAKLPPELSRARPSTGTHESVGTR